LRLIGKVQRWDTGSADLSFPVRKKKGRKRSTSRKIINIKMNERQDGSRLS